MSSWLASGVPWDRASLPSPLIREIRTIAERNIQVLSSQDRTVYVWRGVNRESLSCAPDCEPRITLGDSAAYFDQTIGQSGNRSSRAQAGGAAAAAR